MSPILLIVTAFIYFIVAADYILDNRFGMGLAFTAYALANIGFALDVSRP